MWKTKLENEENNNIQLLDDKTYVDLKRAAEMKTEDEFYLLTTELNLLKTELTRWMTLSQCTDDTMLCLDFPFADLLILYFLLSVS